MPRGDGKKYGEPRNKVGRSSTQYIPKALQARIDAFEVHGSEPKPQCTRYHRPGSQKNRGRG